MKGRVTGLKTHLQPGETGYGVMAAGRWLNDECMNYHIELLNAEMDGVDSDTVVFSTFFYERFLKRGYLEDPDLALKFFWGHNAEEKKVCSPIAMFRTISNITVIKEEESNALEETPYAYQYQQESLACCLCLYRDGNHGDI